MEKGAAYTRVNTVSVLLQIMFSICAGLKIGGRTVTSGELKLTGATKS